MTEEEKIRKRLEYISERLEYVCKRLYYLNPAKENAKFKQYSNERWNLEVEMKRLLDELDKLKWQK